jgi:hypothetical protein
MNRAAVEKFPGCVDRRRMKLLCLLALLVPATAAFADADAEAELRAAVRALSQSSHSWETTTRQRFRAEAAEPRFSAKLPTAVEGKFEPDGYTEITLAASREVAVPVMAIFRKGDVVANTPLGWKHRGELRQTPGPDREVTFEGRPVRLSRFLAAALKVTAMRPLLEDLFDLVAEMKSCRKAEGGLLVAELPERMIETLWGAADAKRAPEIHGTVIFKVGAHGLSEYHVLLGIGFPNSRTKTVAWTMQQWTTRISGIGSTTVNPPPAAVKALAE